MIAHDHAWWPDVYSLMGSSQHYMPAALLQIPKTQQPEKGWVCQHIQHSKWSWRFSMIQNPQERDTGPSPKLGFTVEALAYLHGQNLAHGHLCPESFLVDEGKLEKACGGTQKVSRGTRGGEGLSWKETFKIECFPTVAEFKTSCKTSKYLVVKRCCGVHRQLKVRLVWMPGQRRIEGSCPQPEVWFSFAHRRNTHTHKYPWDR